ncbi:MAG: PolC-type DNA polymerase III, partial [Mycoplasma sp.]|nr:PolC-type DNA polymerase III [Mycoplasma sp.]
LDFIRSKTHPYEISIIAKNQVGLKELFKLISRISTIDFYEKPKLIFQWLLKNRTPNILIGSGSLFSRLIEKMIFGTRQQIIEEIKFYDYIEIQPIKNFLHLTKSKIKEQDLQEIISFVVNEAKKINKLIIATSDARYINVEEKNFHEVFIYAKGLKGERHPLYSFQETNFVFPSFEFLTTLEMEQAFSFLKDAKLIKEIVIENTHKLFNQIEKIKVIKSKLYPPELSNANDNLKKIVFKNAHNIYGANLPQLILDRINRELTPIIEYKYSVIYWISHLLVKKATNSGYLVGSRGSVGSSFVAFLANITEVNPLPPHYLCPKCKYFELVNDQNVNSGYDLRPKKCNTCKIELLCEGQNISFESFLGFNAEKIPDIDLNFSGENQLTIHNEVKNYFGENHTFRAGTISTIADKTAFGFIKSWIEEKKVNVNEPFINFMVKKIVGTKRTTGQHPGGIIVIPKSFDVEDFTPINYPANDTSLDWKTTHFDFDSIHDNLLKLDLLGHDDPTIIKKLETITNVNVKTDISFKDKNVISLFSSLKALQISSKDINDESLGVCGIPEFGTPFVRKMLKTVKVQNFGDLISISGLSHGTNVWNNNGEELVKKQKLKLNQIISCRDDIMNYLIKSGIDSLVAFNIMEQVKKGAGITFEQEQLLIKANIPIWYIESLKKIKYMFPRAHATAYVMMAFRIAWFKIYHKLAFYATYLSTRIDIFDLETVLMGKAAVANKLKTLIKRNNSNNKTDPLLNKEKELIFILEIINEAYARGIKIANIDLNISKAMDWTIDEETQSLIPPFIAIDGLGEIAARRIVEARNAKKFVSQKDFLSRTQLNNTIFEKMKKFGILKNLAHKEQISFNFS